MRKVGRVWIGALVVGLFMFGVMSTSAASAAPLAGKVIGRSTVIQDWDSPQSALDKLISFVLPEAEAVAVNPDGTVSLLGAADVANHPDSINQDLVTQSLDADQE